MQRLFTILGGIGVMALALGLAGCGGSNVTNKTLKFTEKDTMNFGFLDAAPTTKLTQGGPAKLSTGDQLTFSSTLLDSSKKPVGTLLATCAIVSDPSGTFEQAVSTCQGTATVPGGTITLAVGGKVFGKRTEGSITGGTGTYARATGSFTSVSTGVNVPNVDTLDITIVKK